MSSFLQPFLWVLGAGLALALVLFVFALLGIGLVGLYGWMVGTAKESTE